MSRRAEKIAEPTSPGAFLPDGSWNPDGHLHHRGDTHRLVHALCRERRFARLTPREASLSIQASSHVLAFPNWRQWDTCEDWASVWTSTSAEEAVKRAGESIAGDHHWCGAGKWLPGSQTACPDESHRTRLDPESFRKLRDNLLQAIRKAPPLPYGGLDEGDADSETGDEEEGPENASTEVSP
jgi:hypothetical protein